MDVWRPPYQNSSYMVSYATANDQLVGKRNASPLRVFLTRFNIDVTNWEACAQDRPLWRSMIHTGARTAETNRIAEAQNLLYHQHFSRPDIPMLRVLQARIGLISHLCTHRVNQTWHHHQHRRRYGHNRKRWTNNKCNTLFCEME